MKQQTFLFLSLMLVSLFASFSYADLPLERHLLDNDLGEEYLVGSQFLEDEASNLTLEGAVKSGDWGKVEGDNFNRGFNASTWWVRANIFNSAAEDKKRIIEISYPILDRLDVFILHEGGKTERYKLGDKLPFYKRAVEHRNFIIPVTFESQKNVEIYFRAKTQGSMQLPVTIWDPENFHIMDQARSLFLGIFFGIMLVMILYNLFIYFTLGERNYLYYVFFVSSITLFLASLSGYTFQYLWPHLTGWNDRSIVFFLAATIFFGAIFTLGFLRPTDEVRRIYTIIVNVILFLSGSAAVSVFFLDYSFMIRYVVVVAVVAVSVALIVGVNAWLRGETIGKYYTISWGAMLIGGLIFACSKSNILPQTTFTDYAVQFGSAIQVLLLSFALAERINVEKKLRYEAQESVLVNEKKLREAQNQILRTQKKTNELLELRVKERTSALEKLNEKLLLLSSIDKLTGLKNRSFLDDILDKEVAHSNKTEQELSLVLLDVDDFKGINDEYGHLLGDECLKQISNKINSCVQKDADHATRCSMEQFCIVLPQTPLKGAVAVAERLRASIEGIKLNVREKEITVTVSAGVVGYSGNEGVDGHELLKRADKALYKAKANGKNQVVAWSPPPASEV